MHNQLSQLTSVPEFVFTVKRYATAKTNSCTPAAAAGRYERGSKINETRHVLDLRHVVAGLSALK